MFQEGRSTDADDYFVNYELLAVPKL